MCLYIGDVGDNRFVRKFVSIYKVQEPKKIVFAENRNSVAQGYIW